MTTTRSPHFSNLSGLRVERDGTVKKENLKAHIAELQTMLRDIQEELRSLSGGGRGRAPSTSLATESGTRTPFRLADPSTATTDAKIQSTRSLRTGVRSRAADDLVTRRELQQTAFGASGGSGFMDLTTDQEIVSGNKDFGSISYQKTSFQLDPLATYGSASNPLLPADLAGATLWDLTPANANPGGPIFNGFAAPNPDENMLRILLWRGTTSNLRLRENATDAVAGTRINTMSAATDALVSTVGPGSFVLIYNTTANAWYVIARNA